MAAAVGAAVAAFGTTLTDCGEVVYAGSFAISSGTTALTTKLGKPNTKGISAVKSTLTLPTSKTVSFSGKLASGAESLTITKKNAGELYQEFEEETLSGTYTDAQGEATGFDVERASPLFASVTGLDDLRVGVTTAGVVSLDDTSSLVRYGATKLPSGVKLVAKTGVITGAPTKAKSGTATLKATCKIKPAGSTKTVSSTVAASCDWTVSALDTWAQGTFTATGMKVKISKAGRISGTLKVGTKSYRISAKAFTGYSDGVYTCEGSGSGYTYIITVTSSGLEATLTTTSGVTTFSTTGSSSSSSSSSSSGSSTSSDDSSSSSSSSTATTTGNFTSGSLSYTYKISSASSKTLTYKAAYIANGSKTYTISNATISATASNTIGLLAVNGAQVRLVNCKIVKSGAGSGQSNDDNYNFYGINNAIVALGSATKVTLDNCTVTTSGEYANAVFASDNGTITIENGITITTSADSSRGLFASYGGTVQAPEGGVDITTTGSHCAALVTDRGGGTIICGSSESAAASTVSTQKNDSPCIYSTGSVTAYNLTGTCAKGQAVVVEGKNEATLVGCDMTGGRDTEGCIFLYQSSSGDAADSDASSTYSTFTATDCTFTALNSADMILCTHTTAKVFVEGCTFYANSSKGAFATSGASQYLIAAETVKSSQWGSGNYLTVTTSDALTGTVYAGDSTSSVTVNCASASTLTTASGGGTVNINK